MVDISNTSLAEWFAEIEQHRCGYCKNPSGSISFGMMTESLTVEDYQDLIDRGWRRSGKYCYKPTMDKTCCPQYTIRCETTQFVLNKSHKKIIKKFNKFVNDGVFQKNTISSENVNHESYNEYPGHSRYGTNIDLTKAITSASNLEIIRVKEATKDELNETVPIIAQKGDSLGGTDLSENLKRTKKHVKEGIGPDKNKPPCKKAKLLRLERKKAKLLQKGQEIESGNKRNNEQKSLNEFLEDIPANAKHKLKLKLINPTTETDEWEQIKEIEFELYKKYQMTVHNDPPEKLSMRSFLRFLVTSPLKPKKFPDDIEGPGYGSFHQQYWLDDKLIAVGIIDILPSCVSSVYFFYDPDYRDLTLGTYGSLREVQLVQSLQSRIADLCYYYMGFYIHSCPKMRYKGKLRPSYLLCPESYVFVPIEKCLPKLDISKYSRLNDDLDAIDDNACSESDLNTIKVVYHFKLMYASDFVRMFGGNKEIFTNLGKLVGKRSSQKILFWIG